MAAAQSQSSVPTILVSADVFQMNTYRWHAVPEPYLKAVVSGANATPVTVPSLGKDINLESVLERVDGVLMTGAKSNVNPEIYGETKKPEHGPFDPDRDDTTLRLIKLTIERGIPLLAICRGMQELNVSLGGTLNQETQEIDGRFDHRSPESDDNDVRFRIAHKIFPKKGGKLEPILGSDPVEVNSLHRQSIAELSDELDVEATAEDGTIESVSVRTATSFALAVQWHPEYWIESDEPSKKIFKAFGDAAREYRKL